MCASCGDARGLMSADVGNVGREKHEGALLMRKLLLATVVAGSVLAGTLVPFGGGVAQADLDFCNGNVILITPATNDPNLIIAVCPPGLLP